MAQHPEVLGLRGSGKERGEGWGSVSAGVGTAGGPGSGLVPPGKGAALWLLGATTQRKMDASRLPVIHQPGNIHPFMVLTGLYFPLLPKPD